MDARTEHNSMEEERNFDQMNFKGFIRELASRAKVEQDEKMASSKKMVQNWIWRQYITHEGHQIHSRKPCNDDNMSFWKKQVTILIGKTFKHEDFESPSFLNKTFRGNRRKQ